MSEFQKPYSSKVSDDRYRRIFHPYPSCEGCFHSWRTKDTYPCCKCRRDPDYLHCIVDVGNEREDHFLRNTPYLKTSAKKQCCSMAKKQFHTFTEDFIYCPWCSEKL